MLTRRQPLFPGYVFVGLNPLRSRWRAVDSTFGVRSIVKCGDLPVPLPVGCIEALIRLSGEDGLVTFAASLTAGDAVRFLSGPFTGLIGRLEQLDGAGRVTILLDLLGRATPIRGYASDVVTDRSLPQS